MSDPRTAGRASEAKKPFDASDAEQVAERTRDSKLREDTRRDGLKFVMSTKQGRAWMHHLLFEKLFNNVGEKLPPEAFTGSSATFYNNGNRRVGEILRAELMKFCRREFRMMEDEADGLA